jgi:ipoprotein LpqH
LLDLTAALTAVAVTAGCGMTGSEPSEPSQQSGRITVADKTQNTQSVTCSQNDWLMTIDAKTSSGRAHASLQLGGETPTVNTVTLENIDGVNGVIGGDVGSTQASANGSSAYTITGTAIVSDAAHPGQTRSAPFKIEVPC